MRKVSDTPLFAGIDPDASFASFEQILVSNSGEDAFDVAIRLLAAKLEDEISSRQGNEKKQFDIHNTPDETFKAIERLFRKAAKRWSYIEYNGGLGITPEQLVRCMRPLCGWNLVGSDMSHLDAVLERLVARGSKGSLGQYFTPRGVVNMCVEILNPVGPCRVIDPACGSAGFLFEAVNHAKRNGEKLPNCLGIDFGPRSLKVASLMAVVAGRNKIKIVRGNSIDGRDHARMQISEWKGFLASEAEESGFGHDVRKRPWGSWHRLQADVILTNPPFAGDVDDPDVLSVYDSQSAYGASRKGGVGREHLFLERAVNMLATGGRLAIVLPQGILANASSAYLREWLMERCRVLGVVGLHPYAFLPHTGVKTSVLFLEKHAASAKSNYPVFFGVSCMPGKDSRGRQVVGDDYSRIAASFSNSLVAQRFRWAKQVERNDSQSELVMSDELRRSGRLDAEYYDPEIRKTYSHLEKKACGQKIGTAVARNIIRFKKNGINHEIDYIDISAVEPRTGAIVPNRITTQDAPSRATLVAKAGDVLVSTVRPDRNTVALITSDSEKQIVASNGFCLLRTMNMPPELLYAYCKTDAFRRLLTRHATATMYPAVTDRDVLDMPLLMPPQELADEIVAAVQIGLRKLEEAKNEIRSAVDKMNDYVSKNLTKEETSEASRGEVLARRATRKSG